MKLLLIALLFTGDITPHEATQMREQRREERKVAQADEVLGAVIGAPLCGAACIECESSWDPQALSPSGTYWGLYQYDFTSWVDDGGDPATYGRAPAGEQHQVAQNAPFDRWPNC